MKCPHCERPLPPAYMPTTCPACGGKLSATSEPADTPQSPMLEGLFGAVKFVVWAMVILIGVVLLLLAIAFAGCVLMGGMHN